MLDDALFAAEAAREEEACARSGARLSKACVRVQRDKLRLVQSRAALDKNCLQSDCELVRSSARARRRRVCRRCTALLLRFACALSPVPASSQRTSALTGETMESTYSLVSSAVEGLELRQQLAAMQLKLGAPPVGHVATPL
jgi:hypothetical protein